MAKPLNILILGLGRSGVAVARFCLARFGNGFESITVLDSSGRPEIEPVAKELAALGAQVHLGVERVTDSYDVCVASPGIPPSSPLLRSAAQKCDRVISEIEFAFENSTNAWVAVTGTNGKTTTTALVAHLLNAGGVPARAVGNIGVASIDAVAEQTGEVLVAEVSSFQLALTERFHPRVAVLLNITPDHIDWHGSYERYAADKGRVFSNLDADDVAVVDVDDSGSAAFVPQVSSTGATVVRVSLLDSQAEARLLDDGMLVLAVDGQAVELVRESELLIKGPHNVSNALAAAAAAHSMGVGLEGLRSGLRSFSPIEHRLEPAGIAAGAEWFNDSKATNPDAVSKALGAFRDRPLVLLLGGRNKGNDFRPLAQEASARTRSVILFGEAAGELQLAFDSVGQEVTRVTTLADAVDAAARIAEPGDAVVLSPACASFDEFKDYEQRGDVFKSLVADLIERES